MSRVVPWKTFVYKIRTYFNTLEITRGLIIALLGSAFIYLDSVGLSVAFIDTLLGIASLYLLLPSPTNTWFWAGAFWGILWFWWIGLSLIQYHMVWAIPLFALVMMVGYGSIFALLAWISQKVTKNQPLLTLLLKAVMLLGLSLIRPFTFDWFKPELMFTQSYLGIEKWQFGLILVAIILSLHYKKPWLLLLLLFAYAPSANSSKGFNEDIALISTYPSVTDKWNKKLHKRHTKALFEHIDHAIDSNKSMVVLPESVFALYINRSHTLMRKLKEKSKKITIVTGGLYWDGKTPRNSTYIFDNTHLTIANKVILVPFGESNPLPDFLSDWINKIFYDGAVDYQADSNITDYTIGTTTYRNAICFEATSEPLYVNSPKNMIVLSNNGWFIPSIEPTLQKILLQYYSKKYGTTIYHSVNMSASYVIVGGKVRKISEVPKSR